jgi:hypothetical protein
MLVHTFYSITNVAQISLKLYDENIDIVDSYTYLGVVFNYNGNYCTAKKRLIDQANKAFHALYYKLRNSTIPIDLQLKLFDSLIAPNLHQKLTLYT